MQMEQYHILTPDQPDSAAVVDDAAPLMLRDIQPLAEMDSTPADLQEVAEELAGDPYWTFEITPMFGDSISYRPGAAGGKDLSALRADAALHAFSLWRFHSLVHNSVRRV